MSEVVIEMSIDGESSVMELPVNADIPIGALETGVTRAERVLYEEYGAHTVATIRIDEAGKFEILETSQLLGYNERV